MQKTHSLNEIQQRGGPINTFDEWALCSSPIMPSNPNLSASFLCACTFRGRFAAYIQKDCFGPIRESALKFKAMVDVMARGFRIEIRCVAACSAEHALVDCVLDKLGNSTGCISCTIAHMPFIRGALRSTLAQVAACSMHCPQNKR